MSKTNEASQQPKYIEELLKNGTTVLSAASREELTEMVNDIPAALSSRPPASPSPRGAGWGGGGTGGVPGAGSGRGPGGGGRSSPRGGPGWILGQHVRI